MKVTLINPPSPYLENDAAYPPTGLMCLATAIEEAGHVAEIIDLAGGGDWHEVVSGLEADMFGITCVTPNYDIVKEIAKELPDDTPLIIGGAHPTFLPDMVADETDCDAVCVGEGETVIRNMLEPVASGFLTGDVYYGDRVYAKDICKPARHLVDMRKYSPGSEKAAVIYTSRGCPYNCAFCSKLTGRTYRQLPLEWVIEEMKAVYRLGFTHILFGDDDIGIDNDRLKALMVLLKPYNITFRLNKDARNVDEETLELARQAGCTEISYGIESGSDKMLDAMNKKATVADNRRAIELTKQHGMKAKAYLMANFPGETEETVQETIGFIEETQPDKWLLAGFAPLPGSDTWNNPGKYGITRVSSKWEDFHIVGKNGEITPSFETKYLTVDKQKQLYSMLRKGITDVCGES